MFKYKMFVFILLTVALISGKAYCQQEIQGRQVSTVTGKVTYLEPEGGILNVQTDNGNMMFYILVESSLTRKTKPMASIEIKKDDPVVIDYVVSSSGRNNIIKLVDNQSAAY